MIVGDGPFQLHNGKFLLGPTGGFAVHSDCCCNPIACATCTGAVPYWIKAVFSGITICPGCRTMPGGGGANGDASYIVEWVWNGTVYLRNTSACVWASAPFDIFRVRWYDQYGAGCITPRGTRTFQGVVYLRVDGASPYIVLWKGYDAYDPDVAASLYTFSAPLAAGPKDCEALGTITDVGTCTPAWRVANSGQVILSIP